MYSMLGRIRALVPCRLLYQKDTWLLWVWSMSRNGLGRRCLKTTLRLIALTLSSLDLEPGLPSLLGNGNWAWSIVSRHWRTWFRDWFNGYHIYIVRPNMDLW